MNEVIHLPAPCLVVLVGPSASGKSTWAAQCFPEDQVLSSDRLRAVVGEGEDDLAASGAAFEVLELIVSRRLERKLTTVVDTLGLDDGQRERWRLLAQAASVPVVAVAFNVSAAECRARNRARNRSIPTAALAAQLRSWSRVRVGLHSEGFDEIIEPVSVRAVPPRTASAVAAAVRQHEQPIGMSIGLHLSRFAWTGGAPQLAPRLRAIANGAEAAGVDSLWVMDHLRQIPQVGRPWEDLLESWTTLAYLAALTERVRLGTLVTGITFRHVVPLARIVATLDVLSGGRVTCGLGAAWYAQEHTAAGMAFPPLSERYALLEDALQLLPLLWGPGSPPFRGRVLDVPETLCYPRPLQTHVPLLVGGGGERRTLRLVARHADAANVMGDPDMVRRKVAVLGDHCREAGRDPATIEVTHLSNALIGRDDRSVAEAVDRLRPRRASPTAYAADVNAGTVTDHVGRLRQLAEAGVHHAILSLPDLDDPGALERLGEVVAAYRRS